MVKQKINYWRILALVISPIIMVSSGWQLVKAESTPELLISVEFPDGPTRGSSGQTSGGGTRGNCPNISSNLIALMPGDDNAGITIANNPKFFLYIPKHDVKSAEFEIIDKSGESIYFTELDISETQGIVKLSVPQKVNLATTQEYTWRFAMVCDPWDRSGDEFVEGTIKRVELNSDLENSLKTASPLEQAEIYANARIWNEAIATLADLRNSNPKEWEELLTSVGLEDIASEPFAPCCQLEAE
ncbi:MAG: DUF928 domain-containing protein [Trichodesmium sp.]